ncbi:hypothetical protein FBU30_003819 [Linnemannia zychae]|nr:hypothetical protein FBU30_003819 [Linnemannia zychae]
MSFTWSSTFTIGQSNDITKGDKIILPQAALESIIKAYVSAPVSPNVQPVLGPESFSRAQSQYDSFDQSRSRQQELPSPLIFQIRNPANRFLIHGGVREFSADDGQVYLPEWMMTSLALNPGDQVMIKYASLPKGIWAKFRPVTADYLEILDFRALFEAQLRANYTALTRGEVLKVYQGNKEFEFIIEELKPAPGDAVCIIDTDLEVNIEPLEMKADEETILSAGRMSNGVRPKDPESGNSGHVLKIGSERQGRVPQGEYERWAIDIPNRKSSVEIVVHVQEPGDLDVVISTKLPVSLQDHIWANFESTSSRIIIIPASDQDYAGQQDSQTIHVAVYGRKSSITTTSISSFPVSTVPDLTGITLYSIQINYYNDVNSSSTIPSGNIPNKDVPGFHECTNCGSWIPERTKELHNNFCHRNNAKCDSCNLVMKKEDFLNHFHCDHCDKYGDISEKKKHMEIYHGWYQCSCGSFESSALPELAIHRREACPEKLIICRYCHTLVQQGGLTSNMRDRIRGLHSHESYCGDRTIQCQKCLQMVSLKDIQDFVKYALGHTGSQQKIQNIKNLLVD